MLELREVNYKLTRTRKDEFKEEFLVTNGKDYYWSDDYEQGDMFETIPLLYNIVKKIKIVLDNNYNYYIVEDIIENNIPFKN